MGLKAMPFAQPCPPSSATVALTQSLLCSWLGIAAPGPGTVMCIPSKATEAWLAAALLADNPDLMANIECEVNTARILANLPKARRVRKSRIEYLKHAAMITHMWAERVKRHCSQASDFEARVAAALR